MSQQLYILILSDLSFCRHHLSFVATNFETTKLDPLVLGLCRWRFILRNFISLFTQPLLGQIDKKLLGHHFRTIYQIVNRFMARSVEIWPLLL